MPGATIDRRDVAIAFAVSAFAIVALAANATDPAEVAHPFGALLPYGLAYPLALLITGPLLWRRAAPVPALAVALGGVVLNLALLGDEAFRCGFVGATAMLLGSAAAAQGAGRWSLAGAVGLVALEFPLELGVLTGLVACALTAGVWAVGHLVHTRRELAGRLAERTDELRAARDERARLEVATERERVSSELDALLHRRLGELAALAEGGRGMPDPEARLRDIETSSRETLTQMRALVGVLREEGGSPTSPQPTLTHLESLLQRAAGPGSQLVVAGHPRTLPPAVELSAFRVLEHLLTALDGAPGIAVQVTFAEDALELEISGPARRGATAAIERARERVRVYHGTFDANVRRGRAHARVSLPLSVAV